MKFFKWCIRTLHIPIWYALIVLDIISSSDTFKNYLKISNNKSQAKIDDKQCYTEGHLWFFNFVSFELSLSQVLSLIDYGFLRFWITLFWQQLLFLTPGDILGCIIKYDFMIICLGNLQRKMLNSIHVTFSDFIIYFEIDQYQH